MARNMSFMLTQQQFRDKTKTVTRRLGWDFLKAGDILNGCEKCQGLKKGESIVKMGQIRVIKTHQERLNHMTGDIEYGKREVIQEGFPNITPALFVDFFCKHMKCQPSILVNRIEFEYLEAPDA